MPRSTFDDMSDPYQAFADQTAQQMGQAPTGVADPLGLLVRQWSELPRQAFEQSDILQLDPTGNSAIGQSYDPGPALAAAGLAGGGTAFSAPRGALGAGPARWNPAKDYPPAGAFEERPITQRPNETAEQFAARQAKTPTYRGKVQTGQEAELADQRAAIRADMEKNPENYQPIFPRQQRSNIPAGTHPPFVDTKTAAPKKAGTISTAEKKATLNNPAAAARIKEAFKAGTANPESWDWYAMNQLQQAYIDELGPTEGAAAFRRTFAGPMAATTAGADPTTNLISSAYGNWLRAHGLPFADEAYDVPHPVSGGKYGPIGNLKTYEQMIPEQGEPNIDIKNPKRLDFYQDLLGNPQGFTWDEQMLKGTFPQGRLPGGQSAAGVVPQNRYGLLEQFGRKTANQIARKYPGVTPAEVQGRAWAGYKGEYGPPMIEHFNRAIERTRRITGLSPQEIVSRFMRGAIPLYGLSGLAYLAANDKSGGEDTARR